VAVYLNLTISSMERFMEREPVDRPKGGREEGGEDFSNPFRPSKRGLKKIGERKKKEGVGEGGGGTHKQILNLG